MNWNKRIGWIAVVLAVVAGIGFWARPVTCFDQALYLRECFSGFQSSSVQVAGHRLHYLAAGPAGGPVVVLVHGLGGRAEDWLDLSPSLVHAGYRVYMPDLIGYGRSEKPADYSYSVGAEADGVVGFLDALGLKQVDLGGWSMGGWIVQLVASEHSERVRRLIVFDSAGLDVEPDWDTHLFTPTTPAQLNQLEALLTPHPEKIPDFIARDILRQSDQDAWVIHRSVATMLTGRETTDKLLPGLKMAVLLVWGAEDRITPLNQGETMHRLIPQSQLDVFPGCGHLAPRLCAARIGPTVVEFLKQ
jgi:pimeloyl-ACP methyl ester carboxylesterase